MHDEDAHHPNPSLQEKLQKIYTLRRSGRVNFDDSSYYRELLKRLGNPHLHLPPVIHLAGTNGKGSTLATLRAIYEAAGYRTHAYTSPHLLTFNERIYLAGQAIGDTALEAYLDDVLAINADNPVTFFELTTALAFFAFVRSPADLVLLETGMGGRLDCTNIVEAPLATIITAIGRDHTEFLGDTLAEIAGEKAGIMKTGVPCFIAPQRYPEVYPVFQAKAAAVPCPLRMAGQNWHCTASESESGMTFREDTGEACDYPRPNLLGRHQIENAGTALAVVKQLQPVFPVEEGGIRQGLQTIIWPGRMERIRSGRYADLLPEGWELWFDGGHNVEGAYTIAGILEDWQKQENRPVHIFLGMREGKDIDGVTAILAPYAASLTHVEVGADLSRLIQDLSRSADKKTPARLLICGSFYNYG